MSGKANIAIIASLFHHIEHKFYIQILIFLIPFDALLQVLPNFAIHRDFYDILSAHLNDFLTLILIIVFVFYQIFNCHISLTSYLLKDKDNASKLAQKFLPIFCSLRFLIYY